MTRDERLAKAEASTKDAIAKQHQRLAQVQAQQRTEARKTLDRRRYHLGTVVLNTPLARLDDTTLAQLIALLSSLASTADPYWLLTQMMRSSGIVDTQDDVATCMAHAPTLALVQDDGHPLKEDGETAPCREILCAVPCTCFSQVQQPTKRGQ